jgi:hypothetical protein
VIAVDQSEAMVTLARSAGLEARQASVDRLPFEAGAFDAVVAGFLLNHLSRPVEGIAELARLCNARVAVSLWDEPTANPVLGLFGELVQSLRITDSTPAGPDSTRYADDARLNSLLVTAGLVDIRITRVRWTLTVAAGAWFDAVAAGTPRTGAVLAAASADQRAELRNRYVALASSSYEGADGLVTLPATAVIGSGTKPAA